MLPFSAAQQRPLGGRGMLSRGVAIGSALLMVMAVGMVVLQDDAGTRRGKMSGTGSVELLAAAEYQSLWEPDDSVNHDPYFNVFAGGSGVTNYGQAHKQWSSQVVRERVWQTLKDVKAMERHVREQNALNNKMKTQITTLEQEAQDEKLVIRKLIEAGMTDVQDKIALLKNAAMANVTDVRAMLVRIEAEQKAKQAEQDQAIQALTERHQQLQTDTTKKFQQVDAQISAAEQRLALAKARVASEREEVKKLIMEKIRTDVGGLDKEMTDRLQNERFDIRSTIDAGLKQLDGNISDYSLATGIRVARLMNKVSVLKKDQKEKAEVQDKQISDLEEDHKALKEHTLDTLSGLRSEVDETKEKLAKAQETLEAEQALRQSAEEKDLNERKEKLKAATEQSLADAKDEVELKIGQSNANAHAAFAANKDAFHHSVDDLEKELGDFVKQTKKASAGQEQQLQHTADAAGKQLEQITADEGAEEKQVTQTQMAVALANAKLKGEVAEETKQMRLQLLDRMTAVQKSMESSLAQLRTELEGKIKSDQTTLGSEVTAAKATADAAVDSVGADIAETKAEVSKIDEASKTQLASVTASEQALSTSTGQQMTALSAEMKTLEESAAESEKKLTAQADEVEKGLSSTLQEELKKTKDSANSAMLKVRGEVETKMSADMASISKEIDAKSASALADANALRGQVSTIDASAKAGASKSNAALDKLAQEHAEFEAQASSTLAHIKDSLAATKLALNAADKSVQTMLAAREAALKTKVEADMKAVADSTVDKVNEVAATVKAAHSALQQAMAAHKAAAEVSASERKHKLEELAGDLQDLQGKMKEVEQMTKGKAEAVGVEAKAKANKLAAAAQRMRRGAAQEHKFKASPAAAATSRPAHAKH